MTKSDTKNKADVVPDRESDRLPLFVLLRDDTRDHPRTFMCRTLLLLMRYSSADVTGHTVFHCLCISHNRYTSYNSNHGRCTFQRVLYNYCIFCVKNLSIKNFNSISFFSAVFIFLITLEVQEITFRGRCECRSVFVLK